MSNFAIAARVSPPPAIEKASEWAIAEAQGSLAVKLAARKELEKIEDLEQRRQAFDKMVALMYERGKSVNAASHFEFDDVIDPADSRAWISTALRSWPGPAPRTGKKRPCVDTW